MTGISPIFTNSLSDRLKLKKKRQTTLSWRGVTPRKDLIAVTFSVEEKIDFPPLPFCGVTSRSTAQAGISSRYRDLNLIARVERLGKTGGRLRVFGWR